MDEVEMRRRVLAKRAEIIEVFARVYIAETGLLPSQCELVEQEHAPKDGIITTTYHFRRREPQAPQPKAPEDQL